MKELFELFSQSLGPKAYARPKGNEPLDDRTRLFAMYHKKTHDLVKERLKLSSARKMEVSGLYFVQLLLEWVSM